MRRNRKHHLAWEQAERCSGGVYSRYLDEIAHRYPILTPMERRVCVLIKATLPSWRIAEILGVCEATIENHRVNIRRKIGILHSHQSLNTALSEI